MARTVVRPVQQRAGAPRTPWLPVIWWAGLIVAAGTAAYWNSMQGAFLFDDHPNIVENPFIQSLQPLWQAMRTPPRLDVGGRPLVNLTFALNYHWGGLNVWGYHAVNLAIHLLTGLMVFGVVRRTLSSDALRGRWGDDATWLAGLVGVAWTVHPLNTQAVTYIVQRAESMMGMFYLATLYCVVRAAAGRHRYLWEPLALVACGLGMATKAVMVTAPLTTLLYDRIFFAGSLRQALRRRWGLYLGLAATWLICIAAVKMTTPADAKPQVGFHLAGVTPVQYALTQTGVVLHYLRLAAFPSPLCLDYHWPVVQHVAEVWLPVVVMAGLFGVGIWLWRIRHPMGFIAAWVGVTLAPTSSVIPISDPAFEHRMYLALVGLVAGAVCGMWWVVRSVGKGARLNRWLMLMGGGAVALALLLGTVHRNALYGREVEMWRDVLSQRPDNPRAFANLISSLAREERYEEVEETFRLAQQLPLPSGVWEVYNTYADVLLDRGRLEEAERHLRKAVELNPSYAEAHNNLGVALSGMGRTDEAIGEYSEAIRLAPRYPDARNNLGVAYQKQRQWEAAERCYREALRLRPGYVDAMINLGNVLALQRRDGEALQVFRDVLQIDASSDHARKAIEALMQRGR